jgi:hypothetical protein
MPELRLNNFDASSMVADYGWGNGLVDYAADVHNGSPFASRSIARPFTEVAVANYPIAQRFGELVNSGVSIGDAFEQVAFELGNEFRDVMDNHDWGHESKNFKRFRSSPTWKTISDSGTLRNSQTLDVRTV